MLELDNLVRRFGDKTAVDHVSFRVETGLMTGFVGGNGAGKTTTMRMIMGVLAVHGGRVLWDGAPAGVGARRRFGYMPEERGLYPKQPVLAQLVYLGRLRGLSADDARRSATGLLERLGLAEHHQARLETLSLGNQQRVQIVAALLGDPALLVLDEPFSGLDPLAVDNMAGLLREITDRGVPVLFSSHQLDLVERLCDRLVILADGRVLAGGSADELRRRGRPRHRLVTGSDIRWVAGVPDVTVVEQGAGTAVLEMAGPDTADRVLREALDRGSVREFSEIVPSVADVFRELTS